MNSDEQTVILLDNHDSPNDLSPDVPNENNNDRLLDAFIDDDGDGDGDGNGDDGNGDDDDNKNTYNDEPEEYVVGIDLGTTNSCVAIWRNNRLEVIPDEYGHRTIPSFVAFTNVSRYVGNDAKNQREINSENVFYEIKRLIGRKFDDPLVVKEKQFMSYKLGEDQKHNIRLESALNDNKRFTPEELQAAILTKLKVMASSYLKQPITKAVITIPAYFNDGQRQATKDAATIAGLDCLRMINEPTAAGLAYGLMKRTSQKTKITQNNNSNDDNDNSNSNDEKPEPKKLTIMVYDFGGGTLDVTLLSVEDGIFEVIASSGNTRLGGSDFENRLMSFCIAKFSALHKLEVNNLSSMSLQKLRQSCEQAKKLLSSYNKTHIAVKNFYDNKDLCFAITRNQLEELCQDLFLMCLKPVDDILYECEMAETDIDDIILVGGMTRMPRIRNLIKTKFHKEPNCSINPEEAVAAGAAIQAYIISNQSDPFSESVTLLDTTTLSLGVETMGGIMDILIPRKSIIPVEQSREYSTDADYVDSVIIKIFEGERTMTCDNFFVGEFELSGIDPAPRGIPEINVTFNIDQNGIITVMAENEKTNDANSLTVTGNKGRLSDDEIERLIEESKMLEFRDQLEKRKKLFHYQIDDFCNNILVNLTRDEFKLTDIDKKIVTDDVNKVLSWLKAKKYSEYDDDEYQKVYNKITKRYGTLILKGSIEDSTVKENVDVNDNKNCTTIFGSDEADEEEVKEIFEKIETQELGAFGLAEPEKAELKEIKQALSDLCYSVFEIISSDNLNLSNDHLQELKEYIDDTLLWLHIHQEPNKTEYKIKIDEVNDTCNKIIEHYQEEGKEIFKENEIKQAIKSKRDELENMCIVIKLMIHDNAFPINKKFLKSFNKEVCTILDWIAVNDVQSVDEPEKFNNDTFQQECEQKLIALNEKCELIHQKMQGINIDPNSSVLDSQVIILTGPEEQKSDTTMGTSIIDIVRNRQLETMTDMINQNDDDGDSDNDNENENENENEDEDDKK